MSRFTHESPETEDAFLRQPADGATDIKTIVTVKGGVLSNYSTFYFSLRLFILGEIFAFLISWLPIFRVMELLVLLVLVVCLASKEKRVIWAIVVLRPEADERSHVVASRHPSLFCRLIMPQDSPARREKPVHQVTPGFISNVTCRQRLDTLLYVLFVRFRPLPRGASWGERPKGRRW